MHTYTYTYQCANTYGEGRQTLVALPRRAVLEVQQSAACPWQVEARQQEVDSSDASTLWNALPLHIRLALALLDACNACNTASRDGSQDATEQGDAAALREYVNLLPQSHDGALAWSHDELLHLQVQSFINEIRMCKSKGRRFRWLHLLCLSAKHMWSAANIGPGMIRV